MQLIPQGDPACPVCGDDPVDPAALPAVRAPESRRVVPVAFEAVR